MDIQINVVGQKLKLANNYKKLIDGSQNFIRFVFNLDGSWDDLTKYAQFTQNGASYNIYLDDYSSVYIPPEINIGECTLTLCGTGNGVVATTDYITLDIDENILTSGEESTEITESLYEQLIDRVNSIGASQSGFEQLVASEEADRKSEDEEIRNLIDSISSNQDLLTSRISNEVTARSDEDANIRSSIDDFTKNINIEKSERIKADNSISDTVSNLRSRVDSEAETRRSSDENIISSINNISKDIKSEENARKDDVSRISSSVSSLQSQINIEVTSRSQQDAALNARIDKLIAMEDGSTTGDIELQDIRIGYDGTEYDTAGTAVRTQITDVNDRINNNTASINTVESNIDNLSDAVNSKVDYAYVDNGVAYFTGNNNVLFSITDIGGTNVNGLKYENKMLYLTADDEIIGNGVEIAGGSGSGGSDNNAILTVTNTTGWIATTVSQPQCSLSVNWSSVEDDMVTGDGTLTIRVNNIAKLTRTVKQGDVSVNIGSYLSLGANSIRLSVSDIYGNTRTINFTVNYLSYTLSSLFDGSIAYSGDISYYYVATGAGNKLVHFLVDGNEIGTELVSSSGRQSNYYIGKLENGSHTLEVYFSIILDEQDIESNHLFYDLICADSSATDVIISCPYTNTDVIQFDTCVIPYVVYDPANDTSRVVLSVDGVAVSTLSNVDRSQKYWSYRATTYGTRTLTIESSGTVKTIVINVQESDIDVHAETSDLSLYLSSSGRSNDEENPATWSYGEYRTQFTDFVFDTDGWVLDNDGNVCLKVRGNNRLYIPYLLFGSDCKDTGKTIEFEFTTSDTIDTSSPIISCMNDGVGLVITPQEVILNSGLEEIRAQFKENEHIRVAFTIEKANKNRLVLCYINGIASGCIQYTVLENTPVYTQLNPVGITIGSNDATIDLYTIRIYDNDLTRYQILDNWIADTQNVDEMLDRYNRNNIYDEYGKIVISKLPSDLPYMVISGTSLPTYKGDKKTVSIQFEDPTGSHPSFSANNVQIDVQGTSSAGYARKNFKCKFKNGFILGDGSESQGYKMNPTSIPTSTFTFKADVASSEGANNVELVRLYNDYATYKTNPQELDPMVRQGIDGFPMVVFHNDGNGVSFVGKYNFNNDKGTEEVYGFEDGDESWEIKNNTDAAALFMDDDFSNWEQTFEGRYPDGNTDTSNLQSFVSWVASTDTTQATGGSDTAEYRLNKFKTELADHANVKALIFYYIFTELFLMIDSRAKNAFPSFFDDKKWLVLPYDFDTAIGINNQGKLQFGPYLEDTDVIDNADVYNGQKSVLWNNLRECFGDEIAAEYDSLRTEHGLSYAVVESRFEQHQSKWPEAIFNEDAYYKYIEPLTSPAEGSNPTNEYLGMLLGSKQSQRQWWLYNRFNYIDNKYQVNTITTTANRVYFRAYAIADMVLTPVHDTYLVAKYGSAQVQHKAKKDIPTTMECTLTSMNNTECYVYGCENIKDLGDLSPFNLGDMSLGAAVNLQYLKIGDAERVNTQLLNLDLSTCKKLKVVDLRNCVNLTGTIDVSNCYSLEELYLTGTQVTGVNLPRGGQLKKLHLPAVNSLVVINHPNIEEFVYDGDYSTIQTLWLDNVGAMPVPSIVSQLNDDCRVRLTNINWHFEHSRDMFELYKKLRIVRGIDQNGSTTHFVQIDGKINVDVCDPFLYVVWTKRWFTKTTIEYTASTGTYDRFTVDNSQTVFETLLGENYKSIITKIELKSHYDPTGSEQGVYTIASGNYAINVYLVNDTEIIVANNGMGYIVIAELSSMFQDFTALEYIDLNGALFSPSSNASNVTENSGIYSQKAFSNTPSLRILKGLEYLTVIKPGGGSFTETMYGNMFTGCGLDSIDLRAFYSTSATGIYMFMSMPNIEELDFTQFGAMTRLNRMCIFGMPALKTVKGFNLSGAVPDRNFTSCPKLTNCIFATGTGITWNTGPTSTAPMAPFDYDSVYSLVQCLVPLETPKTIKFSAATFNVLDDEIVSMASAKGYTLAKA